MKMFALLSAFGISGMCLAAQVGARSTALIGDDAHCAAILSTVCTKDYRPTTCTFQGNLNGKDHLFIAYGANNCLARAKLAYQACLADQVMNTAAVQCFAQKN